MTAENLTLEQRESMEYWENISNQDINWPLDLVWGPEIGWETSVDKFMNDLRNRCGSNKPEIYSYSGYGFAVLDNRSVLLGSF